jgi:hypothetical protein
MLYWFYGSYFVLRLVLLHMKKETDSYRTDVENLIVALGLEF